MSIELFTFGIGMIMSLFLSKYLKANNFVVFVLGLIAIVGGLMAG